ncbi:MAG: tRNA (adenosine(37)-N6)-threonylcarbamoyltransferase complex dimerization subunit type 1 TsaB, partial [Lachnospiraceae bacterium]|nr:tRNA (adenosine(37)-N6)-threonylcarbamoyltransferase complex dimerization subunit type 1 TsaB [Lachnospiraceae bacterium]
QCAVSIEEITQRCNELGREVVFLGDGVPVFRERLPMLMSVPYSFAPAHKRMQSAAAVGVYAGVLYRRGIYESAAEHQPEYLRLSQAERERKEACGAAKAQDRAADRRDAEKAGCGVRRHL